MNSLERIMRVLNNQKPDRIPVTPILLLQGAKMLGLGLEEYFSKSEYMVQGQQKLVEKYDHDAVYGIPHIVEDIEAFGGKLLYFESGPPSVGKLAWNSWDDVPSKSPDPLQHPAMQRTLSTIKSLAKVYKGEKLILGAVIAPFSLPSMLIGTERWMELLWEDELIRGPIMKQTMNVCMDFCIRWANAQLQAGADTVVVVDGMASATCIMREQFETLALPILKETIHSISGTVAFEPLGSIEPFIDLVGDIGASLILLEHRDNLKRCKQVLDGKMAIMGNLNNIEMIRWEKDTTRRKALEVLKQIGDESGFILSNQGPEIPWDVSEEVIQTIVDTAKSWPI